MSCRSLVRLKPKIVTADAIAMQLDLEAQADNAIDIMAEVDSWPRPWRLICYQVGYNHVVVMRREGFTPEDACDWHEIEGQARDEILNAGGAD